MVENDTHPIIIQSSQPVHKKPKPKPEPKKTRTEPEVTGSLVYGHPLGLAHLDDRSFVGLSGRRFLKTDSTE